MYGIKLTNTETNAEIYVILPVTNSTKWASFIQQSLYDIDYTVADELVNSLYDTDKYTAWTRYVPDFIESTWEYPTGRILGEFGYNQLSAFKYTPMTANAFLMRKGMWTTESGLLLEVGGDGSATLRDPVAHTSESFNTDNTWLATRPSASTGMWRIYHISDPTAFFHTYEENIENNEGSGYGLIWFSRIDDFLENNIWITPWVYEEGASSGKEGLLWWKLFTTERVYDDDELRDITKDPYQAPISNGGVGGNGTWYDRDDTIPIPSLPSIDVSATNMITIFNPTLIQLQQLASYLWSGNIEDIISKMWADPMDVMMGLSVVGCTVPSSTTQVVSVAGRSTGISMNVASRQYIEVDCGTVTLERYYDSYMDYSPYTKVSIYLPFLGSKELDTDIVQGHTIGVKYHCDILTGSCVAFITVDNSVKYAYNGNISTLIPFTSANFSRMMSSAFGLVTDVANVASGTITGAVGGISGALQDVENSKPQIHRSGNIGSTTGLLSVRIPYLIIERPNLCIPQNQNHYVGYPSYTTVTVGNLSGYTEFEDVRADSLTCSKEEQDAIIARLKEGVII